MSFLGVYRAIYDYAPQSEGELQLTEGDLLFVLEKSSEDDWWKAKKKAMSDEEDEPEGLVPQTYIEEAQTLYQAKALYDYSAQTDEEISFSEESRVEVYDVSDPDWTLIGLDGHFGFAPAIYVEKTNGGTGSGLAPPPMPTRPQAQQPTPEPEEDEFDDDPLDSPVQNPAKALAGIIAQKTGERQAGGASRAFAAPPSMPARPQYTPEESDEEQPPPKPARPQSYAQPEPIQASRSIEAPRGMPSPQYGRGMSDNYDDDRGMSSPRGFHLYNIHEMISHLGKNKKMPTTLGINVARGLISISPEKQRDGPQQEWTAEKLTHYSIEGKHVFVELVRPSKSADFHAGAKDTAQEIVAALGELAGASRAEGLREVIAAGTGGTGQRKGAMLYDFMAQGDDEVTVAAGDEVIIIDDTKSEEWWMVKRMKNGKEGVVPSSYVEITGTMPQPSPSYTGLNVGKSIVEQNRLEEERLARENGDRQAQRRRDEDSRAAAEGPGAHPPARGSSKENTDTKASKPKPNTSRVRTWTDRSGSFKVEAEFIGLKDGKIHLHKLNGVKIAVPVNKMAIEDLEYVENVTGVSLEDDKPLSDIKRRSTQKSKDSEARRPAAGASVQKQPDYDWFDFFLQCGCGPQICERYARAFAQDQMGEEVLPDVTPTLLRTLGIKEGDNLRIMKNLDARFGRTRAVGADGKPAEEATPAADGEGSGGLFSGPGGTLRNNTRKGRPAPAVQTNDVIDADAFRQEDRKTPSDAAPTPLTSAPARQPMSGFDDDAWDLQPSKTSADIGPPPPPKAPSPAPPAAPVQRSLPTGGMAELSLLSPPLQPQPTAAPAPQLQAQPQSPARPTADPSFFDKLGAPAAVQSLSSQPTGRARPLAPQTTGGGSSIAPPPQRAVSAPGFPQTPQQSQFGAPSLAPQMTGYQQPMQTGYQAPPGQSLSDLQRQQQMQQMPPPGYGQQFTNGLPMQATGYQQPYANQNYNQQIMQGQMTGSPFADPPRAPFQPQATGFQAQPTGFQPQQSSFGAPTPTTPSFLQPQQTSLPPPLTPMRTGFGQPNGFAQPPPQQYPQQAPPQMYPQQTGFQQQQPQPQPQFQQQMQTGFPQQQQQPMQTGFNQAPFQAPMPTGFGAGTQQFGNANAAPALVPQQTGPAPAIRFGVQPGVSRLTPQPTGRRANLANASAANPFGF